MVIKLIIFIALIIVTSFFVIAEFAIVRVRRTRIVARFNEGEPRTTAAMTVIDHLDSYLSACQLGITMTSLGIGWIGEPTVAEVFKKVIKFTIFSPQVNLTISSILAFVVITFINVVFGELAPKTIAIQKAETMVLLISRPLIAFNYVMYPFIWLLNSTANLVSKFVNRGSISQDELVHSEEELRQILSESYEYGKINSSEYRYVNRIFEFDDRIAKEIMVPRTEVVCLYKDQPLKKNLETMQSEKFTRYPVACKDKDHIIGMVNIKEIFHEYSLNHELKSLNEFIHPIIEVIETIPIKKLLVKMQKEREHMAVLLDEYGGTSGIITVEDILEEIVGEIRDEFDTDERPMIEKLDSGHVLLDGKVLIEEVNELFNLSLNHEELDTMGGLILSELPLTEEGEELTIDHVTFRIVDTDGHQVKMIEAIPETTQDNAN